MMLKACLLDRVPLWQTFDTILVLWNSASSRVAALLQLCFLHWAFFFSSHMIELQDLGWNVRFKLDLSERSYFQGQRVAALTRESLKRKRDQEESVLNAGKVKPPPKVAAPTLSHEYVAPKGYKLPPEITEAVNGEHFVWMSMSGLKECW